MSSPLSILLVGCGAMGSALLKGALAADPTSNPDDPHGIHYTVVDPARPEDLLKNYPRIQWHPDAKKIDPALKPALVVLAVKPQHMATTLPLYSGYTSCVYLSIAAGITLEFIEDALKNSKMAPPQKDKRALVRAMPNLPASIGHGAIAAVANEAVSEVQKKLCFEFLSHGGRTLWIKEESSMDAITALSGSGPAYVYALCEAMQKAGEDLGLDPDTARMLARDTVVGSGYLLEQSELTAAALRQKVTSPGGTTEAALKYLLGADGLFPLLQKSMSAAKRRGQELAWIAYGKK